MAFTECSSQSPVGVKNLVDYRVIELDHVPWRKGRQIALMNHYLSGRRVVLPMGHEPIFIRSAEVLCDGILLRELQVRLPLFCERVKTIDVFLSQS